MSFSTELDFSLFFMNKSVEERLAESAAKIAFYNFEWRFVTFVVFNTAILCGEEVFAKFYNKSIIVSQSQYDKPNAQATKQHVLFATDNDNIEFILHWMQKRVFDNTGKHIIICLSENKQDCNESEVMRILWHYKVTDVVFIRRAFNQTGILGFTYYPLEDSRCDIGPPIRLNNLDACVDLSSKDNCKMFPRKLRNLHGCSLTVSTFDHPPFMIMEKISKPTGVIADMMWLLEERLNATFKIMTPRKSGERGVRKPDGSWVGSLGDVYHDYANLSLTFAAMTLDRVKYFDVSITYYFLHLVWITHPAQFEPPSLKLLRPFCKYTRLAVASTFTLVIASALLTKTKFWTKLSSKTNMNRPRSSIVFYSWMLFMGLPTNVLPKKRTLLVIVYIWIWYTFLIRTIYQASLIKSLKTNVYLPNYDTIESAIDAGIPFGGGGGLKQHYFDYPMIYNKWRTMNESDFRTNTVKISEGYKFMEACPIENLISFSWKFENRKPYILPQMIAVSPTGVYFKKYSPLVKPVNHVLRQLIEGGIMYKIIDDYTKVPISKDRKTNEPITLEHFTGCYIILFTGWVVSFVSFICEIIFHKFFNRN